jgi:hypothetical protein
MTRIFAATDRDEANAVYLMAKDAKQALGTTGPALSSLQAQSITYINPLDGQTYTTAVAVVVCEE